MKKRKIVMVFYWNKLSFDWNDAKAGFQTRQPDVAKCGLPCLLHSKGALSIPATVISPSLLSDRREGGSEGGESETEGGRRGETAKAKRFRAFPLSAATVLLSGPLSPTPPRCFPKQSYTKLKWGSQTSVDRGRVTIWHWLIETRDKECHWLRHFGWMISLSQHIKTWQ